MRGASKSGFRARTGAPSYVGVVSLDRDETWLWRLRRAGGPLLVPLTWSQAADRGSDGRLTLVDSAVPREIAELEECVRSLVLVSQVVVSTAEHRHTTALLEAGAVNVLHRDAPPGVLVARLDAELRWLGRTGTQPKAPAWDLPHGGGEPAPSFRTQSLLIDILRTLPGPVCCHDVRRLLGAPGRLMTLRALRSRIQRLAPHLAELGIVCVRTVRWGADTLTVHALDDTAPHPAPRRAS
ncbi:hypothetical protein [Streptomyces sp. NPDC090025]|uniref:hypothetical protein n=1 Tax=Streptomyces sp. NPDC090025 TaxID=3365922 RepID=UPI003838E21C